MKDKLLKYLNNSSHYWWTVGILPGLYALTYLYTRNYTLVNSWTQFSYLVLGFIVIPSVLMWILHQIISKKRAQSLPFFYSSIFIIHTAINLSLVIYLGWRWKALIAVGIIAIVCSYYVGKHYKKGVLLLGMMCLFGITQFSYYYFTEISTKKNWIQLSTLTSITFKKKPNIYFIQPDGYASKTALENKHYAYNNNAFYEELIPRGFTLNHNYRSNYPSTLTSNATLFTGQHHFFENGNLKNELFNARDIIMGSNPVLDAFKNNGYETTAVLQHRYLLLNHPDVAYDRLNINDSELSILPNYQLHKDYFNDLKDLIETASDKPQFYFVEVLEPGHITGLENKNSSIKSERNKYINNLNNTSTQLFYMVDYIIKNDKDAIIILAADHGGFVGYNYTEESYLELTNDVTLQQGIYGALFAIKAPSDFKSYQSNIKSSISLFPTLMSYLANQPNDLTNLDDSSYQFIKSGTQRGIYKYYDENGVSVTEKTQ